MLGALPASCVLSPDPPSPVGLVDSSLEMALWRAAKGGNLQTLRNLLAAGALSNAHDILGNTALHWLA
ncbi:hypothetical protein DFAR_2730011 [Desulfarculales bacterium]